MRLFQSILFHYSSENKKSTTFGSVKVSGGAGYTKLRRITDEDDYNDVDSELPDQELQQAEGEEDDEVVDPDGRS